MSSKYDVWEDKLQDPNATPISLPLNFLKAITHDFSTESELGRGGFGVVYKGVLQSGKIIAVKKLFEIRLKEETFHNEVRYLMGIKHQHIVQLVGYCAESTWEVMEQPSGSGNHIFAEIPKRLLCFEYICNKGLDKYISDESLGLEWNMRYEIIKGICSGLHFLHEECRIVHLDLKPENILMGAAMIPKIADFGLSRIFGDQQSRIITDSRAGTCGYMAPEYQFQGVVSIKADIFSLGVIIVEMMTGRREYPFFQHGSPQSVDTSFRHFKEKVLRSWRNKFMSTSKLTSVEKCMQQVEQCITIALKCVDPETVKRPTAKDIIQILHAADQVIAESINKLPDVHQLESESDRFLEEAKEFGNIVHDVTLEAVYPPQGETMSEKILMKHNPDHLRSLDTHPTEPWILTGHDSGYARIWNHEMKQPINQFKVSKDAVSIVKFIARKEWIVAITSCGELHVYGCACATEIGKITSVGPSCPPPEGTPTPLLAVHPILQYVLSPDIVLLDWDLGWKRTQSFHNADEKIVAFNPEDDNSFVSGSFGGEVKVWRLGCSVPEYSLPGHLDTVTSLDFLTGGGQQYLITGSDDCTAKIWDLRKRECIFTLEARSPVRCVLAHPSLPVLVTGTKRGIIHVWSSTDFRLSRTIKLGCGGAVVSLGCLMGSRRIVIGQRNAVCTMDIHDEEAISLQET